MTGLPLRWRFRPLGAVKRHRQSTLALTVDDRQHAVVAPTHLIVCRRDQACHGLLTNDPHRG
jgi:hypothetical protein